MSSSSTLPLPAVPTSYPLDFQITCTPLLCHTTPQSIKTWISHGLTHMYGFHGEEAVLRCFTFAITLCADQAELRNAKILAHLLASHTCGPNYNFYAGNGYYEYAGGNPRGVFPSTKDADYHCREAVSLLNLPYTGTTEFRATFAMLCDLVNVESLRACPSPSKYTHLVLPIISAALYTVYAEYNTSAEVAYFYAESLMLQAPWKLFTYPGNEPLSDNVDEIASVLIDSLKLHPTHIGLCHLQVHFTEMSSSFDSTLTKQCCDVLRNVTDCPHLLHMSTHIDCLTGDYESAVTWNSKAIKADVKTMTVCSETTGKSSFFIGYIAHDVHMKIYAAMLGGYEQEARDGVKDLIDVINPDHLIVNERLLNGCEGFLPLNIYVLIRFGRWEELLAVKVVEKNVEDVLCVTAATIYYGRGVALAALGRYFEADLEMRKFEKLIVVVKEAGRFLHNNMCHKILECEFALLEGEIRYAEGKFGEAFAELRKAVVLDDEMNYDEPWGIMLPTRHALGGLLTHLAKTLHKSRHSINGNLVQEPQGYELELLKEAELVFMEDLKVHPVNPWALFGLIDVLTTKSSLSLSLNGGVGVCGCGSEEGDERIDDLKATLAAQRCSGMADFGINASCACANRN